MEFDFEELKQLAMASPAAFAKRRAVLIDAALARCKNIDGARLLQAMIDQQRWRHGAGLRSSQDLLDAAIGSFDIIEDAARTLGVAIRAGAVGRKAQMLADTEPDAGNRHIRSQEYDAVDRPPTDDRDLAAGPTNGTGGATR